MIIIESFVLQFFLSLAGDISKEITNKKIEFIGPTNRKSENNLKLSYNIYPRKDSFNDIWHLLESLLKLRFNELSKLGEVINYDVDHGAIADQGTEYFKIQKAFLFECYIYEPESFLYARLLHEFDIIKKSEWISIDLDGIEQSAWFEE